MRLTYWSKMVALAATGSYVKHKLTQPKKLQRYTQILVVLSVD